MTPALEIGLLGPLAVRRAGEPLDVPGVRLRALLCRLALDAGRPVPATELLEAVWGDELPAVDPTNALQSLVSRLRRVLGGAGTVGAHPTGYRLANEPTDVDVHAFQARVSAGQQAAVRRDAAGAAREYRAALAWWRGEPLADAGDAPYAEPLRARWVEQRLTAVTGRLAADLELAADPAAVEPLVPELEELVTAHPLREELAVLFLTAMHRVGRTPEALQRFERLRRHLADEFGTDPGPALRACHLRLLQTEPPVPSRTAARDALPRGLTSFVGREADLVRLHALLDEHRLVCVLGPGGAGKTRLAVETGHRWLQAHEQPGWLVELAPVTDPDSLAGELLAVLGLRENRWLDRTERPVADAVERLVGALADRPCLLVVDNCEHLIEPLARLLQLLLARAPDLRVLATSREPLGLTGEHLYPLAPLGLPPLDCSAAEGFGYPAVALLRDRAGAARPDAMDDALAGGAELAAVLEIVRRLDGLPLAIELAAARFRVLSATEVADRLSDRFRLLTGGSRTSLPRHRTLRAVVEWSWDLLTAPERLLAERLAVFPGGVDIEAAQAVAADDRIPAGAVEDLLLSLADKSLLQPVAGRPGGGPRFRMLETIREFGQDRLAERDELAAARTAHGRWFADLAEVLEPQLRGGAQVAAMARLELERDNLAAAMRSLIAVGEHPAALRLGLSLFWWWSLTGRFEESTGWYDALVRDAPDPPEPDLVYIEAALTLARFADGSAGQDWDRTRAELAGLCDRMADGPDPPFPGLEALRALLPMFAGREDIGRRAIDRAARSPDRWVRAASWSALASFAENTGDLATMRTAVERAHPEFVAIGDRWGISSTLSIRAQLAVVDGRLGDAVADYEEALRHVLAISSAEDSSFLHLRLADLCVRTGDLPGAHRHLAAIRAFDDQPSMIERTRFADGVEALVLLREGDLEGALGAAAGLRAAVATDRRTPLASHAHAVCLAMLSEVALSGGDVVQARTDVQQAYLIGVEIADMPILAGVGEAVAGVLAAEGHPEAAAEALGAADRLRGFADTTNPWYQQRLDQLRDRLGPALDAAYARGWDADRTDALRRVDPDRSIS